MASPVYLLILSLFIVSVFCSTSFSIEQVENLKTIKTNNGVYDCVNFYKQPAFSNHLLINHTSKAITNLAELQAQKISGIGLGDDACPIGTVPISRAHSDVLISGIEQNVLFQKPEAHCVAVVHTNNLSWKLYGVGGLLTLYKPKVENNQWSRGRIKLLNGDENIEAGWMMNPSLYKDNEVHLYVRIAPSKGIQYPGFIQVSRHVPLGVRPNAYSEVGGTQRFWNITLKMEYDGNWWLYFGVPTQAPIGYLPKEFFTTLADFANQVEWGGEIDNPGAVTPIPEMGNGYFASPRYDFQESAAVAQATIIDDKYNRVTPGEDTHKVWDCESLYTVKDADYKGEELGRLILYGGPNAQFS